MPPNAASLRPRRLCSCSREPSSASIPECLRCAIASAPLPLRQCLCAIASAPVPLRQCLCASASAPLRCMWCTRAGAGLRARSIWVSCAWHLRRYTRVTAGVCSSLTTSFVRPSSAPCSRHFELPELGPIGSSESTAAVPASACRCLSAAFSRCRLRSFPLPAGR